MSGFQNILESKEASIHKSKENRENTGTSYDACQIHFLCFIEKDASKEEHQSLPDISEHGSENKGIGQCHKPGRIHFVVGRKLSLIHI